MDTLKTCIGVLCIALLISSCEDHEPIQILTDYEVAMTNNKALRYYYHRMPENDTTWTDYRTTIQDNQKFVTEEQYAAGILSSRSKYRVEGERYQVVEKMYYYSDSLTKEVEIVPGKIVEHRRQDDQKEYPGFSFVDYYEMSIGLGMKLKSEARYVGKETYHFNGDSIESIKFDHDYIMITYFKWLPFYFHETQIKGYVILSKGIGMTYYWAKDSDNAVHSQTLVKVEELI